MNADWPAYYRASLEKPLHPIWEHVDPYLQAGQMALDLGCGVGGGTLHLLDRGLRVVAVDQEAEAIEISRARAPASGEVHFVQASFQELRLDAESFDVVSAFFALFFLSPPEFGQVWQRVVAALRPGGIFAGQFLGIHDDWASRGYTVHTRSEVESILHSFDVIYFEEAERDGETALKEPKHWHVFHVVARKL